MECQECQACLCTPCVVLLNHVRIGHGQQPSYQNRALRKICYSMFWGCLADMGMWKHPRYLRRKRDRRHGVFIRRELMPDCVVEHVRSLLPSPVGQSYMENKRDWIREIKGKKQNTCLFYVNTISPCKDVMTSVVSRQKDELVESGSFRDKQPKVIQRSKKKTSILKYGFVGTAVLFITVLLCSVNHYVLVL